MTIASLADEIGLPSLDEGLVKGFPPEHVDSVMAASAYLADRIREDIVVVKDIDSFIKDTLNLLPKSERRDVLEYLLAKKGMLLCQKGAIENGQPSAILGLMTFSRYLPLVNGCNATPSQTSPATRQL